LLIPARFKKTTNKKIKYHAAAGESRFCVSHIRL
jgi:hypothetical protein